MTSTGPPIQTEAAAAPPHVRYYRPELDALRFVAFLGTFAFHRMEFVPTDPVRDIWSWRIGTIGAFGVPVFFLLSAFLITELLLREASASGRVHITAFYIRRILRIWPLYFAVLFGLVMLNRVIPGVSTNDPLAWLAFALFAGNWYVTLNGWIAGPIDPLWTISVEEQFYLVIPVVAARGGGRALVRLSIGMLLVSYATIAFYAWHRSPGDHGEWTNSFVHFQFFAAGTLLAIMLKGRLPGWSAWQRLAGIAVSLTCWFAAVVVFDVHSWNPQPTVPGAFAGWSLVLAGAVLLLVSTLGVPSLWIPMLLAHLGRISYGLYLFHSLILLLIFRYFLPTIGLGHAGWVANIVGTAVTLGASIAAAQLSYVYFEGHFLRRKRHFTHVLARDE